MFSVTLESIVILTVFVSIYGTYLYCSKPKPDEDDISSKKNDDIKIKIKNSPKSFSDFGVFLPIDEMDPLTREVESTYSCSSIQKTDICFRCKKNLYGSRSVDYFAFDRQYCRMCWQKINRNITKSF